MKLVPFKLLQESLQFSGGCPWVPKGVCVLSSAPIQLDTPDQECLIGSSGDVWRPEGAFGIVWRVLYGGASYKYKVVSRATFTGFSDEEYNFCRVGKIKWKVQKRLISNSTAGKSELGREKVLRSDPGD